MTLTFQINYRTQWGQALCVIGECPQHLDWTEKRPLVLNCQGTDFWTLTIPVDEFSGVLSYKYAVRNEDGSFFYEDGKPRSVVLSKDDKNTVLRDFWQADDYEKSFLSTAFQKSLFRRQTKQKAKTKKTDNISLSIHLPQILPSQGVAVMGSADALGNWDADKKLPMSDADFPVWRADFKVAPDSIVDYKYAIYDLESGKIVDLEYGENRKIWGITKGQKIDINDRSFRRTQPRWKGAGVAVPVFSLRTDDDFGVGEFADLKKFADWAAKTGQKMIQTLPINDTTLLHTNRDSYPYNAVSVFALNPIYINIEKVGKLPAKEKKQFEKTKAEFNAKSFSDYQVVADEKMKYLRLLFKQEGAACLASKEFKRFFEANEEWLVPYAAFCYLRDLYGTPHFVDWKKYSKYDKEEIQKLSSPKSEAYDEIALHYFIQFHLNKQLAEAVDYAHSIGVAMKGDIPIGISPDSVDAWTDPQLFNLDAQAGAPPDDFSISGQNWGFPTYNWDVMAQDGFRWWKRRFTKMADYFDAYRIDHILGFFRIWQMPKDAVWGLTGHFSPAMPYSMQDLWNMGISVDEDRLVKPYIRSNFLGDVFGYDTEYAKDNFLLTNDGYIYYFRPEFDTQKKVEQYFEGKTDARSINLRDGLLYLHCEVLFVRDQKNQWGLHPRIALTQSHSFNELPDDIKGRLAALHDDYFYRRHNDFWWQSAMSKLPALISATDMLVCGEDLGMVPDCVPDVMHRLQILSLEIQRMPKDPHLEFAHPADAPYLSVCTTGTHDMNPLRAWWEEDRAVTQKFYNQQMGWWGEAPQECTPEIVSFIINQHMYSPAMWVILPLQDYLGIDAELRLADPNAERINVPANPRHFWCYRMHLRVEDLLANDAFCNSVRELVKPRL